MVRIVHPIAGMVALLTIAGFWLSTVLVELFGSHASIIGLKTSIPWLLALLIPALLATGASGFVLAKGQRTGLIGAKAKRMPLIAANGLLVLVPSAFFLASKARAAELDTVFYAVQALELIAGATNLLLLGLGMRDGRVATAWKRRSFLRPSAHHDVAVLGRELIARDTIALRLARPRGFSFRAGQALYMTVRGQPSDDKGRVRTFSIASAPHEEELLIATRVSASAFKQALQELPLQSTLAIEGPYGDLTLHADERRPAVMIAGGIGITPFRSIIVDAIQRRLGHRIILFYSNRTPERAAFLAELMQLQSANPLFTLVATMTDESTWSGEQGAMSQQMIARHLGDVVSPVYYIAGPASMVSSVESVLRAAGVAPGDIHVERFAGY